MSLHVKSTTCSELYPLSLHDALPICCVFFLVRRGAKAKVSEAIQRESATVLPVEVAPRGVTLRVSETLALRSEEHTSELQSLTNLVCRLVLEIKKAVTLVVTGVTVLN